MEHTEIRTLSTPEDLRALIAVFATSFETDYDVNDDYLHDMIANPSCLILGAAVEGKIVGGLVAFEMTPIHGDKELYLYDIAVHPEHQKKGIGTKLVEYLKTEAVARGVRTIFVEAESGDEGAVSFYRAVGGQELSVNHFNFKL